MDIGGYQDRSFDGVSFIVRNAGNLRQQGFELDTALTPAPWIKLNASLAYLDSKFTSFPTASGLPGCAPSAAGVIPAACLPLPNQGQIQDLKGKPATYSPEWMGNFGVEFNGDIGSGGMNWNFGANLSVISEQFITGTTDGNTQGIENGYALLGARFTLNGAGRPLVGFGVRPQSHRHEIRLQRHLSAAGRSARAKQRRFPRQHCSAHCRGRSAHLRRVGRLPLLTVSRSPMRVANRSGARSASGRFLFGECHAWTDARLAADGGSDSRPCQGRTARTGKSSPGEPTGRSTAPAMARCTPAPNRFRTRLAELGNWLRGPRRHARLEQRAAHGMLVRRDGHRRGAAHAEPAPAPRPARLDRQSRRATGC